MTEASIENGMLVARMTGVDVFLAARRKVAVPLAHVVGAEETTDLARQASQGWKLIGGYFPGWFRNGTFREHGQTVFWNVTGIKTARAVTVTLRDERFARFVLAVRDPEQVVAMIRAALPASPAHTNVA